MTLLLIGFKVVSQFGILALLFLLLIAYVFIRHHYYKFVIIVCGLMSFQKLDELLLLSNLADGNKNNRVYKNYNKK
jgi:hypothetical protein